MQIDRDYVHGCFNHAVKNQYNFDEYTDEEMVADLIAYDDDTFNAVQESPALTADLLRWVKEWRRV